MATLAETSNNHNPSQPATLGIKKICCGLQFQAKRKSEKPREA